MIVSNRFNDNVPKMNWPLAIVTETFPSDDNLVRRVKVKIGTKELNGKGIPTKAFGVLERPIQTLVVLVPRHA